MKKFEDKWKYPTVIILLLIFIGLLISVVLKRELYIDTFVYNKIILNVRSEILTNILKLITMLSSPKFLFYTSIIIFLLIKGRKEKICFTFNICFITSVNQLLKRLIVRPRPAVKQLVKQGGYSFPSGHAMASVAFYGYLIYLIWQTNLSKKYKYISTIGLTILTTLICFSRIYLGVHYTSDVIAGACLSLIHLIIYIGIIKKKES